MNDSPEGNNDVSVGTRSSRHRPVECHPQLQGQDTTVVVTIDLHVLPETR